MSARIIALARCRCGAAAAEFAMVLPLLILLLFGIIDAGRWLWTYNQAEKATQMGARMAIVTNVLAPGLIAEDYAGRDYGDGPLKSGDLIPAAALGVILCNSDGCSCPEGSQPCPDPLGTMDAATFAVIVARMKRMFPAVTAANVEIRYSGSGLGSAGAMPSGAPGRGPAATESMEISPLITVSLRGMTFTPITTFLLARMDLPDFRTTLTAEDASGIYSS